MLDQDMGLVPGQGTKFSHATQHSQNKKKKKTKKNKQKKNLELPIKIKRGRPKQLYRNKIKK